MEKTRKQVNRQPRWDGEGSLRRFRPERSARERSAVSGRRRLGGRVLPGVPSAGFWERQGRYDDHHAHRHRHDGPREQMRCRGQFDHARILNLQGAHDGADAAGPLPRQDRHHRRTEAFGGGTVNDHPHPRHHLQARPWSQGEDQGQKQADTVGGGVGHPPDSVRDGTAPER